MNQGQCVPAFILHRRAYRDTSLLLELFTQTEGRISVIAKGAKRPKSPLKNGIQLFQPVLVSWQGKHDLLTLTQTDSEHFFSPLPDHYLAWGFYLNELLYRLLGKHDPYPDLFIHYQQLIFELSCNRGSEKLLRLFERELLTQLGYGLQLTHEANTQAPIDRAAYYHFLPSEGAVRTHAINNTHYTFKGHSLVSLAKGELDEPETLHDAKRLLRFVLTTLLGDKPLKSRELLC